MISDIDILRSAQLMICQHGEKAVAKAEQRAAELAGQGALAGAAAWRRIAGAMRELPKECPNGTIH